MLCWLWPAHCSTSAIPELRSSQGCYTEKKRKARQYPGSNSKSHPADSRSRGQLQEALRCQKNGKKQSGHHARPRRASATAPPRTGADTCKTGSGAAKRSGAELEPVRRRSSHAWTEDQAGKRRCANTDVVGGWRVHTADDTPSRSAATRPKHCNFMCQGDIRPRAAAGAVPTKSDETADKL